MSQLNRQLQRIMSIFRKFRKEKSISQEEMAKKLKISVLAYRNYELGRRKIPPMILLRFLEIRNLESDEKLIKTLKEFYD